MISYAGVYLGGVVPHVVEAVERQLSPRDVYDFEERHWPGAALAHLPFPAHRRDRPVKLNTLLWPRDASRWAVGYFLVDDADIAQIRSATSDGKNPATFVMDQVSTSLYMLPVRPVSQITGANGLSILTLVDHRWFWWQRPLAVAVEESVTTWSGVVAQIQSALGVGVTADAVNSAYLKPPPELVSHYRALPPIFDAAALSVGQRVIREYDGTVRVLSAGTSRTRLEANLTTYATRTGGGVLSLGNTGFPANDLDALLPSTVRVVFRKLDGRAAGYVGTLRDPPDVYTKDVTLSSLALSEMQGRTGRTATKVIHSSAGANYLGGASTPENQAELDALATRIARDYYLHRAGPLDLKVAGAVPWVQEGLTDSVEFSWRSDGAYTRVQRDAWEDTREDLLHWSRRAGLVPFWAQVTGVAGGRYAWTEQIPTVDGTFDDVPNGLGRDGTTSSCPAYEANDKAATINSFVQMWRGFRGTTSQGLEFIFHAEASAPSFSGCKLALLSDFNVVAGGDNFVPFNEEIFDTDDYFDSGVDNAAMFVPTDGYYHIGAYVKLTENTLGTFRAFRLWAGGIIIGEYVAGAYLFSTGPTSGFGSTISSIALLEEGDEIKVSVVKDGGGTLVVVGNAGLDRHPTMWAYRIKET